MVCNGVISKNLGIENKLRYVDSFAEVALLNHFKMQTNEKCDIVLHLIVHYYYETIKTGESAVHTHTPIQWYVSVSNNSV